VRDERALLPDHGAARPLSIDLSSLAGKRVRLRLAAEKTTDDVVPLVFEAPKIEARAD
jgi:hypothetical protein